MRSRHDLPPRVQSASVNCTDLRPAQRWPLADADFGIVHAKVKGRRSNKIDDSCPFGGAL